MSHGLHHVTLLFPGLLNLPHQLLHLVQHDVATLVSAGSKDRGESRRSSSMNFASLLLVL
jgi:hypothetical protein